MEIQFLIELLGLLVFARYSLEFLYEVYKTLQPMPDLQARYGKGVWAVVTGSTDGIGKAYCQQLSRQHINIVLVARNEKKAQEVIKELSVGSKSQFRIVVADFQQSLDLALFDRIYDQVKDLDVGMLINNVGLSVKRALENHDLQTIKDILTVNLYPITMMSKRLLPKLAARKRSAVINLSSIAGRIPIPFHQTYSATKAFDDYFSRGVNQEYSNIDILSHRPFFVTTPLTNYEKGAGAITSEQCATGGLRALGLEDATHGFWKHRIQGLYFARLIPEFVKNALARRVILKRVKKD